MALNSLFRLLPLALVLSLPLAAASLAEEIKCPDISTRQGLEHPVAGWTEKLNDSAHALDNVMFFDGDPKEKASLAPSQDADAKGKYSATWRFGSNQETQVWVACTYVGTKVFLARPLAKTITQCTVTYGSKGKEENPRTVERISCK